MSTINLSNYLCASKVEYFGTDYSVEKALILNVDDYSEYVIGFIKFIFHDDQYKKLFFMGTIASCRNINGNIEIQNTETTDNFIISFVQLLDPFPLNIYVFNKKKYLIRKHSYPFL